MKRFKLKRGDRVEVFSARKDKYLGEATFIKYIQVEFDDTLKVRVPQFRLGRRIIHGYECWWIPVVPFRAQAYAALRKLQGAINDPLEFFKNSSTVQTFQVGDWLLPTSSAGVKP